MICELAATLKSQQKTLPEYLDALYCHHGYFSEGMINIYYEGASGSEKIKNILETYHQSPPKEMGNYKVTKVTDFKVETIQDADGQTIPKQDFFIIELDNHYRYAIRGSGTEPKIKCYLFAKETVPESSNLSQVKEQAAMNLKTLKAVIEKDMRNRAEAGNAI